MDNLTHSLVGALIGQTGLKRLSGLGMPTLIVAANIPDIDAACFLWLGEGEHLGFRRGITHGPLAMLLLPLLLTATMVGFDRWQARRGRRPAARAPVRFGPLYLLALIGTLSHPAFDWLNNYGIRLLEPFASRWFYGDSIFIIDVWMWVLLVGGIWWSRRGSDARSADRRGRIAATALSGYILANGIVTGLSEARTADWVRARYGVAPDLVVASPVPLAPWQREMLWRGEGRHGRRVVTLAPALPSMVAPAIDPPRPIGLDAPALAPAARRRADVRAFLFWSRMPFVERRADGALVLRDQRFAGSMAGDRFSIVLAP